tara:strand:- start:469 stop:594 length:126 start_codon:yes stop_codon:yes gene_type:complete
VNFRTGCQPDLLTQNLQFRELLKSGQLENVVLHICYESVSF